MQNDINKAEFVGTIGEDVRKHQNQYGVFYKIVLYVQRKSGTIDKIPMIAQDTILESCSLYKGLKISVKGIVKLYRGWDEEKQKRYQMQYVKIEEVRSVADTESDKNEVFLSGILLYNKLNVKTSIFTKRKITEFPIRCYRTPWSFDRIWCVAWGRIAYLISRKEKGEKITFLARFQTRDYIKRLKSGEEEKRTAYEISIVELIE